MSIAEAKVAAFSGFPPGTASFLRAIAANNDKKWFDSHRDAHDALYVEPARAFVEAIGPRLGEISPTVSFDPKVNGSLFRIQRDVRFSKDKTPYKNHIDLWFWHGARRGRTRPGFFLRMFAERVIIGTGMHKFEKKQLDAYRRAVVDDDAGAALVEAVAAVSAAGPYIIGGASRTAMPRGFKRDHERAGFLLHEGLWASLETRVGTVAQTPEFVDFCLGHFAAMWPISRWLLDEVAGK